MTAQSLPIPSLINKEDPVVVRAVLALAGIMGLDHEVEIEEIIEVATKAEMVDAAADKE